jgi:hypothetical protein
MPLPILVETSVLKPVVQLLIFATRPLRHRGDDYLGSLFWQALSLKPNLSTYQDVYWRRMPLTKELRSCLLTYRGDVVRAAILEQLALPRHRLHSVPSITPDLAERSGLIGDRYWDLPESL